MITLLVSTFGYLLTAFGIEAIKDGEAVFLALVCEMLLTVFGYGFWLIIRGMRNDGRH